ncbi:MAG: aminotransferase class III-fold pyridoxal phosphate-dependent enzyme [Clostridia bacterium]|nr:aminotransferase class III-fold pyridoxal phosphate-dependent enzyme [Clostridia bacterium]
MSDIKYYSLKEVTGRDMTAEHYGVSRWADPKEINAKLKELTDKNVFCITDEEYKRICSEYYDVKCAGSKKVTGEAKKFIPGGVQHNLAFNKPFPMCMVKAEGAYLYDIDGNKYTDFLQAGGPTILGSNFPSVQQEAIELIKDCGPVTGLFHEAELLIAKEINKHMPGVEMFRMLGSGTESVMAAIRVARCATRKKRVIKVGGAYHGWSDQMVYGLKIPGTRQYLESHGIPNQSFELIDEVRPNDLEMLEDYLKANRRKGGTACVIVEPVGPESGTRPVAWNYNKGVELLCRKYGALFIFDEVVTGFRVGLGGAQGLFGVNPDLTIFGKIVAGGYPAAGGVGGKKEYVSCMAAGVASGMKRAYVGGTLAANPLSAMAGYCAIKAIADNDACVKAGHAGDRLTDGLVQLINKYNLPYVAYNQGSIVHLECTAAMSYDFSSKHLLKSLIPVLTKQDMIYVRKEAMEMMGAAYMANGIVTLAGSRLYTSMADTDEVIDEALGKFEDVFKLVAERTAPMEQQVADFKKAHGKDKEGKAAKKAKAKQEIAQRNADAKKAAKQAAKDLKALKAKTFKC